MPPLLLKPSKAHKVRHHHHLVLHSNLTHGELVERCKISKKREYNYVAKNKQMASKIEKLLESRIVEVSSEVSKACGDAIAKKLKSGDTESLSSIFIAQQLKAQSVHKNGM